MENYSLGRQAAAGLGKESTYGTAVAPDVWLPFQEFTVTDQKVTITDNSGIGTREDTLAVDTDHTLSQGNFNGVIYSDEFGHMLLAALGALSTADHSTATGVKVHTFTPGNTLPSYTIASEDTNEDVRFAGALCNEFTINGATGGYANFTSTWLGRKSASAENTPAFTDDLIRYQPKDITIKYASNVAGLSGATPKPFQQFALTLNNNTQTIARLGSANPDFVPGIFSASLTMSKSYFDTEFKSLVFGSAKQAVQITLSRPDITIGTHETPENNTHPSIAIIFEPGYFAEWAKQGGLDDLRTEDITFQPIRNFSTSKAMSIVLTTTEASY